MDDTSVTTGVGAVELGLIVARPSSPRPTTRASLGHSQQTARTASALMSKRRMASRLFSGSSNYCLSPSIKAWMAWFVKFRGVVLFSPPPRV